MIPVLVSFTLLAGIALVATACLRAQAAGFAASAAASAAKLALAQEETEQIKTRYMSQAEHERRMRDAFAKAAKAEA